MKALRQKFGINENMTHVEKGLPEEVIPDLAEHLQAGIVVLGTVGPPVFQQHSSATRRNR
ncbi:universal stress protein E [Escherichia coli]|uniref:Universal stress protein E n=1 Tax=Escherichia coli TaxID=562 RepID=A0A376Y8Z5_ECOLX|nr:universal stress protein E [Escherichia coli]